jgi:hypothetical protein
MRWNLLLLITGLAVLTGGCVSPIDDPGLARGEFTPTSTMLGASSEIDLAEQTLISFFDAISKEEYKRAAALYIVPNPLAFLYSDINPANGEALLSRACGDRSSCQFYCWRIKDVMSRVQVSPAEYSFTVRFEDGNGNLLVGGDNVTPRVCDPPGCTHSEYVYAVVKLEDQFYVDGIPVFTGCWP